MFRELWNFIWIFGTGGGIVGLIAFFIFGDEKNDNKWVWGGAFLGVVVGLIVFFNSSDISRESTPKEIVFSNSTVLITIPRITQGTASLFGYNVNFDYIEERIFTELRKKKYKGNISIRISFISKDEYGKNKISNPVTIGSINADDVKKYENYYYYKPVLKDYILEYIKTNGY